MCALSNGLNAFHAKPKVWWEEGFRNVGQRNWILVSLIALYTLIGLSLQIRQITNGIILTCRRKLAWLSILQPFSCLGRYVLIGADLMVQKVREIFSYMLDDNLVATIHSWSKRKDYIGKEATRSENIEMQIQSSFLLLFCWLVSGQPMILERPIFQNTWLNIFLRVGKIRY